MMRVVVDGCLRFVPEKLFLLFRLINYQNISLVLCRRGHIIELLSFVFLEIFAFEAQLTLLKRFIMMAVLFVFISNFAIKATYWILSLRLR